MGLGNTIGTWLGDEQVDIAPCARGACRQQNGFVIGLPGDHFCAFTAADHLRGRLLRLQQPCKGNIQRHT